MDKYVEFKEIGMDMEVEIYDVSDNKVDTGIVTSIYDEESYVINIYSTEKGTFEGYPEHMDYNIKILNKDSRSAETAIAQEYVSDLMKEFRKHSYLMEASINHYETEKATLGKSLRAMNSLSAQQHKYLDKIIGIKKELSYYGRDVEFYSYPRQSEDYILVGKDDYHRLQSENNKLSQKLQELDDANGEGNEQCQCKQCKCSIGN
ncbi:hypothetical protein LCFBJUUZ_CDS0065 [Staphylococcus phage PG-2021_76]